MFVVYKLLCLWYFSHSSSNEQRQTAAGSQNQSTGQTDGLGANSVKLIDFIKGKQSCP